MRAFVYFLFPIFVLGIGAPFRLLAAESEAFGKVDGNDNAALIGILYDLKQTQKREPSGIGPNQYSKVLGEFLEKDWSESVLNRYFRATRPLYTTQIFIPLMGAQFAPKAFGMEKVIKPSVWIVYYKGQVAPPEDGTYRFVAYADDIVAIAVNGRTVLLGGRHDALPWKAKTNTEGPAIMAGNGNFAYSQWIEMKKDEPVDLDVLIGERPGGNFCAFLLYEKQGVDYPKNEKGLIKYPLFQLAPHVTPVGKPKDEPPFSQPSPNQVWKGFQ